MVPSLTAVDDVGRPLTPGLLYGDSRGRGPGGADTTFLSGEAVEFLRWTAREAPDAKGYWPATAVANYALAGEAVLDNASASTTYPLFDGTGWSEDRCAECGATADRMPRVEPTGAAVGQLRDADAVLAAGSVDALCEQLVAGADRDGDVVVLCGTTLIVWITIPEYREVPGLWTLPHTTAGKFQIGGPSNAGGLFLGWVNRLVAEDNSTVEPGRVPVWSPYVRGERTPYHDPDRRAVLDGLDLTHGGASVRRAGYEASGFVVRQLIELSGAPAARIVATGGGTRVQPWMQAMADATGLPGRGVCGAGGRGAGCGVPRPDRGGPRNVNGRRRPLGVDGACRGARSFVGRRDAGPLRPIPGAERAAVSHSGAVKPRRPISHRRRSGP